MHIPEDIRSFDSGSSNLVGMMEEAEKQARQLDSDISELQKQLAQMQARKCQLAAFASHCTNLQAPISRLPPETLLQVFSHYLPETGIDIVCRTRKDIPIFSLAAVCFSWRSLLLSQPLLWNKIELTLPHREAFIHTRIPDAMYAQAVGRLNLCYRRSGDAPMALFLIFRNGPLDPTSGRGLNALLRRVAFGARRWERIDLGPTPPDLSHWMGHVSFPNLRVLNIVDGMRSSSFLRKALATFASKSPLLESLALSTMAEIIADLGEEPALLDWSILPSSITQLDVRVGEASSGRYLTQLHRLISHFPNLKKLRLGMSPPLLRTHWQLDRDLPPLTLDALTNLDFTCGSTMDVAALLLRLEVPNLHRLALRDFASLNRATLTAALDWAKSFGTSLEIASLSWTTGGQTASICQLINAWSGLKELYLEGPGLAQVLTFLGERSPSGCLLHVPGLKSLVLELRSDSKEAFLSMMSERLSDDIAELSRLAFVHVSAPTPLVDLLKGPISALTSVANRRCWVEYRPIHDSWRNLGLDQLYVPTPTQFEA